MLCIIAIPGMRHINNTYYNFSVPCAEGTYYSNTDYDCVPCDYGYYQDEQDQSECKPCPGDKSTYITGAVSEEQCKGKLT